MCPARKVRQYYSRNEVYWRDEVISYEIKQDYLNHLSDEFSEIHLTSCVN